MKIYKWIDKINFIACFKFINTYQKGLLTGKPKYFALNVAFWPYFILRLLLLCISAVALDKKAYAGLHSAAKIGNGFMEKFKNIGLWIFGLYFFKNNQVNFLKTKLNPVSNAADFSLVIYQIQNLDKLSACLESVAHAFKSFGYEIILISPAQTTMNFLKDYPSIKVISECKIVAKELAKKTNGSKIIFIQCNSAFYGNWGLQLAEASSKLFEASCSKIVNQFGLTAETGFNIIGNKIVASNLAELPEHPFANSLKQVDFCSANGLVIEKFLLENGQVTLDFSQKSIELGKNILNAARKSNINLTYHPLLTIVNHQYNFDEIASLKLELAPYPNYRKTILLIDDIIPTPNQDSGSNRIFELMKLVKSFGYHILYVPCDANKTPKYFEKMVNEGFEVLYGYPNRKGMLKLLNIRLKTVNIAWLCKPHNNEIFKYIFDNYKHIKWIYDTVDLHFVRIEREALLTNDHNLLKLAKTTKSTELQFAKKADLTLAVTNDEKNLLLENGIKNVAVIPNIHTLKTNLTDKKFSQRNGLLFIGGYRHKPNIDAVLWLVNEIMPLFWEKLPDVKITLLGSYPPTQVSNLENNQICVPGFIEDVSPFFYESRVFVTPLRFGAGMKGKIGQSLEYGLPIVSTDIGVEGINLQDGKNVMIANDKITFAQKMITLYTNETLWNEIRTNSTSSLTPFTPQAIRKQLNDLLKSIERE